ncbi:MAG: NAD(P)/FAD-dependent oxidoreductase [Oscillospiraceae bacterium]|nr:NAD(P)/FAD-dependent oxidoreductase [Oscillospiraceae bacterium]
MQVAILGGGASGLMAAITAAEGGHAVTVFERQARVGRKLLATGNGRCNLSNMQPLEGHYHGLQPDFAIPALHAFSAEDARAFFRSLGLLTVEEPSGRVYPFSDQAGSVVDVLRFAAEARGVELRTGTEVFGLRRLSDSFLVGLASEGLYFDRVIVCCGGIAGGKLGGTKSGYELLASLGHAVTPLCPALVQLKTPAERVRALKGVRADARIRAEKDGAVLSESEGEVQFTEYGLSGPAAFEVSRAATTAGEGVTVRLDLLRNVSLVEAEEILAARCRDFPLLTSENLLTGLLHNRLGRVVLRDAGFALDRPLSGFNARALARVAGAAKDFTLPVTGNMGFENAQVTAGGVSVSEFDPCSLQSRLVPGLYAAGEVLDVDGDCGGFNLQWAWASGRLAGRLLP